MDKKSLILKLSARLDIAKTHAQWKEDQQFDKRKVFVESKTRLNPKLISNKQYYQIAEFYNFLEENEDLTLEEIREILKSKPIEYGFLRKLDKLIPDFFEELKHHGPMCIAIEFVNSKVNKEHYKILKRELP